MSQGLGEVNPIEDVSGTGWNQDPFLLPTNHLLILPILFPSFLNSFGEGNWTVFFLSILAFLSFFLSILVFFVFLFLYSCFLIFLALYSASLSFFHFILLLYLSFLSFSLPYYFSPPLIEFCLFSLIFLLVSFSFS